VDCLGLGEPLRVVVGPIDDVEKAVVGPFRLAVADTSARAIIEGRPYMFWTQEEAQEWADTRNDIDLLGRGGAS